MLIYNYKKEFIGIDEKDLQTLGLDNLEQLRAEAADFADLFVKEPGYVHNFQHVHWIDYIACADSTEQPKVIINVHGHLFKADIIISTAYLADNPVEKAYLVTLNHLRIFTDAETSSASPSMLDQPAHKTATEAAPLEFTIPETQTVAKTEVAPEPVAEVVEDHYDHVDALSVDDLLHEDTDIHQEQTQEQETPREVAEAMEIPESIEIEEEKVQEPAAAVVLDEEMEKALHSEYTYNPQIASDELGLPLDLIEEFIEDFINQAKEFKPDLYSALDEGDVDNVKILSHKLKGVAANLRIEDALEVLTTINTTSDLEIARKNLNVFYVIIAKLAGEEALIGAPAQEEVEDEIVLDFKDEPEDEISIADEDVPEQIDLPELADDHFVAQEDDIEIALAEEPEDLLLEDEFSTEDEAVEENIPVETTKATYSKDILANEIGLDAESVHDLLEDFTSEAQEIISSMKTSVQNDDLQFVQAQARQLQGMSNNIRFSELSDALQNISNLETMENASNEISKVEELLKQISLED